MEAGLLANAGYSGKLISHLIEKKKIYIYIYLAFLNIIFVYLVSYFWLCCVFITAWGFSSCSKWGLRSSGHARASRCGGFSTCRVRTLGCVGFSSCGRWAL